MKFLYYAKARFSLIYCSAQKSFILKFIYVFFNFFVLFIWKERFLNRKRFYFILFYLINDQMSIDKLDS